MVIKAQEDLQTRWPTSAPLFCHSLAFLSCLTFRSLASLSCFAFSSLASLACSAFRFSAVFTVVTLALGVSWTTWANEIAERPSMNTPMLTNTKNFFIPSPCPCVYLVFRATRLSHRRLCRIRQEPASACSVGWRFKQAPIIPSEFGPLRHSCKE